MGTTKKTLILSDLRGGQNGTDSPLLLSETQVVSATNVDYWQGGLGRKRNGCAAAGVTFTGGGGGPFDGPIKSLFSYAPSTGQTKAELWAVGSNEDTSFRTLGRLTGGTTWVEVTPADSPAQAWWWRAAALDGQMFVGFASSVNRLHVWDGTYLRRVGMQTPAAATVADTGAGAYAATIRYYKVSYIAKSGSTIVRRSELSPSVTFTPSGGGTHARVTKPAATFPAGPNEYETHWELWGSADDLVYYLIATTAVATTTFDDNTAPASYSSVTGTLAPTAGANTPPPSAQYLISDGNRLVMAGCWETSGGYTTPKTSRVWFTPVLGASDIGDAERVPLDHYIDINENDGDIIRGLASFDGAVYVFKSRGIWKLIPTGNAATPYQIAVVSRSIGTLEQNTIVEAEDERGDPALYFLSLRGPYRLGSAGLQYLGRDNEQTWHASRATIITYRAYAHTVYHADKHQVWWWVPTSGTGLVKTLWVFDVLRGRPDGHGVRGGWSEFTGPMSLAWCSQMYATTISTTVSVNQSPYIGYAATELSTTPALYRCDTGAQDIADNYQGLITTKAYALGGLGRSFGAGSPTLIGGAQTSATTITVGMVRDFGQETNTGTVTLTAECGESSVIKKVDGLDTTSCGVVQFTIGDAAAANTAWTLDALIVPYDVEEPR